MFLFHIGVSLSLSLKKNKCVLKRELKKNTKNKVTSVGEDVQKLEPLCTVGWECKMMQSLWKTLWQFLKQLKIELPYDLAIGLQDIHSKELKPGS